VGGLACVVGQDKQLEMMKQLGQGTTSPKTTVLLHFIILLQFSLACTKIQALLLVVRALSTGGSELY
jgi:hypothetical protein